MGTITHRGRHSVPSRSASCTGSRATPRSPRDDQTRAAALGYLATFSIATLLDMSLITALISTLIAVASQRVDPRWLLRLGAIVGLASIGLGVWMGYEIGIVDGLFVSSAAVALP